MAGVLLFSDGQVAKTFFYKLDVQKASTTKISLKKLIVCQPISSYSSILTLWRKRGDFPKCSKLKVVRTNFFDMGIDKI
jgi:hypothetical protein